MINMKALSYTLFLGLSIMLINVGCKTDQAARADARASLENNAETEVTPAADVANNSTNTNENADPNAPITAIEFKDLKYDFGTVEAGEKVNYTFEFTNTGNEPLVLSNVKPSCGCTTPSWTREPIAPGERGNIEVEFDSKGKNGKQTKTVTVTANTDPARTTLTISGDVLKVEDTSS